MKYHVLVFALGLWISVAAIASCSDSYSPPPRQGNSVGNEPVCASYSKESVLNWSQVELPTEQRLPGQFILAPFDLRLSESKEKHGLLDDDLPEPKLVLGRGKVKRPADDERQLRYRGGLLNDDALQLLANYPQLVSVSLMGNSDATDKGIGYLSRLENLTYLRFLAMPCVSDVAISRLTILKNLRMLSVAMCGELTDKAMADIAKLTTLEELSLSFLYDITDAGLKHLHSLSALRWIDLTSCHRVTDSGVAALQKALPALRVRR